jgi:RNA polymerase sigma-70 factor (ECF subfamily)
MERQDVADNNAAVALLEAIGARDTQALTKLHAMLGRRIYAFSLRLVRDVDLANQVVTDTLFDVWRFPHRFNGKSKVSTWVLAIAKHKALHALRQRHSDHVDLDDVCDTLVSEIGDPEASSLGAERAAALWRCIESLPDTHRECLHLVFYEGMRLAEVAEIQMVPENTVKTRLFHARKKLQACLSGVLD